MDSIKCNINVRIFSQILRELNKHNIDTLTSINELSMTLNELKAGQSSIIIDYRNGEPSLLRRLIEMGFALGEPVKLLRKSPFKSGPVIVEIRNTIIGLGKEESDMIEVEGAQDA